MASSSVSQESIDIEDYDLCMRRSRIRMMRGRATSGTHKMEYHESMESGDHRDPRDDAMGDPDTNGISGAPGEHESPTRLASRMKDKRNARPNYLHKGKAVKDKRKLREKRRSTGVVHLQQPSTESTGDSLDEEGETRKNTAYNEFIDADNPQTPEEERKAFAARSVRNKSPSDLEADLEDNRDYDSTVSQSETNLSTIGHSSTNGTSSSQSDRSTHKDHNKSPLGGTLTKPHNGKGKISHPEPYKVTSAKSSANQSRETTPTSSHAKSTAHSSLNAKPLSPERSHHTSSSTSPFSQRTPRTTPVSSATSSPSRSSHKPFSHGAPTLTQPRTFRPQAMKHESSGVDHHATDHARTTRQRQPTSSPLPAKQTIVGSPPTATPAASTTHAPSTAISVPAAPSVLATPSVEELANKMGELELALKMERTERQREREERQRLQELLMERDRTIQELKQEITFLHQELETIDGDNKALHSENQTLLKAITRLSVTK